VALRWERRANGHAVPVAAFLDDYLLGQTPPRGLLDLTRQDLRAYLTTTGRTANRVSFRRFVRFLTATGRLDYDLGRDLPAYLRRAGAGRGTPGAACRGT